MLGMSLQKFDAKFYISNKMKPRRYYCAAGRPSALSAPAEKAIPAENKNEYYCWILDQILFTLFGVDCNVLGSDSSPGWKLYNDDINQP